MTTFLTRFCAFAYFVMFVIVEAVDGETWCVIVRNDIYGDSSSVIINKSQEISLINFYFNKTVFTHFIIKAHVQNPLFLTLLYCTNINIHMMNLII